MKTKKILIILFVSIFIATAIKYGDFIFIHICILISLYILRPIYIIFNYFDFVFIAIILAIKILFLVNYKLKQISKINKILRIAVSSCVFFFVLYFGAIIQIHLYISAVALIKYQTLPQYINIDYNNTIFSINHHSELFTKDKIKVKVYYWSFNKRDFY